MHYFVGWDVGAWGCRPSSSSQDALVVLMRQKSAPCIVKKMWRGNLACTLQQVDSLAALINEHCETGIAADDQITIAIDTPLGLPADTVSLFTGAGPVKPTLDAHARNSLIYRRTEMWLARKQFPPLSAIKDMIGSQATKGMYLLHKFGLSVPKGECGLWTGRNVTAIECYPTTCKRSDRKGYLCHGSERLQAMYRALLTGKPDVATDDEEDAVYCALIAYLYECQRDLLVPPQEAPPTSEGWVWYPKDAVGRQSKKNQKPARNG
jgi:predicted nuclease with RNAse H fold